MDLFKGRFRITSARLEGYDYSTPGYYFVTICTKNRICHFGEIENGQMQATEIGRMATVFWQQIPEHFPHVILEEFIIMPNHVHGILQIRADTVETQNFASLPQNTRNQFGPQSRNLSSVIRGYKMAVTKRAKMQNTEFSWQPRFHDHIIRDDDSLQRIRTYIRTNPKNWQKDDYYP